MAVGGVALKGLQWFLRGIEFCCAAIILGIFSYFLATLHNHGLHIDTYIRAVEGISGAGVLYTLFGLLLVCCLGGIAFLSLIAMLLDLAFSGAFIYVAYATRGGDGNCRGNVNTPFGSGNTYINNSVSNGKGGVTILPSLHTACRLETATFAVAIIAAVFFFLSIFVEVLLIRHHKKEKAFGPGPNNGYTAGTPRRKFWKRKPKRDAEYAAGGLAAEKRHPDALPVHSTPVDVRHSYNTDATAVGAEQPVYNKYGNVGGAPAVHGGQSAGYRAADGVEMPADDHVRTNRPYSSNQTGTF